MLRRGRLSVDQACSRKNHGTGRGNEGRLQIRLCKKYRHEHKFKKFDIQACQSYRFVTQHKKCCALTATCPFVKAAKLCLEC